MADTVRPMSFLPAIKCSDCGMEIEISKLADHVCSSTPARTLVTDTSTNQKPIAEEETPLQISPKSKLDRAATFSNGLASKSSGLLKPGRMPPPPRIDSSAASELAASNRSCDTYTNHSQINHLCHTIN